MPEVRLLSGKDVETLLSMDEAISVLESAFTELIEGRVVMPVRTPIRNEDADGVALFMPAFLPSLSALGAKIVTVYPHNPTKFSLPAVMGTVMLLDPATGAPVCIMDAGYLTAMRTGAVSGVATKYLAREDAKVHSILGTGVQARTQAWAVATVRKLEKCLVHSIDPMDKKQAFAKEVESLTGVSTGVADSAESAVAEADILTLATSSASPVLSGEWLKPGTHINAIGSHAPKMRELDTLTVQRSKVVVDSLTACQAEAGDFIIPVSENAWSWDKVYAELGELTSKKKQGRENPSEITLFKSVGLAIQDISTAKLVLQKAINLSIGQIAVL